MKRQLGCLTRYGNSDVVFTYMYLFFLLLFYFFVCFFVLFCFAVVVVVGFFSVLVVSRASYCQPVGGKSGKKVTLLNSFQQTMRPLAKRKAFLI